MDQMNTIIGGIHDSLSGGKEKLLLSYEPDISPGGFRRKTAGQPGKGYPSETDYGGASQR